MFWLSGMKNGGKDQCREVWHNAYEEEEDSGEV